MDTIRKIIHVDMDAFYASVEQRDFPEYIGKPLVVGGNMERGVISAASYEARRFGIRSAMSSRVALKKCPDLIFMPHRFSVYKEVSMQIRKIFLEYTDLVEPLSLDEAFLDVTSNKKNMPSASLIAKEIRQRIKEVTNLNASAGISVNKFIAKVASDINKPNGQFLVAPKDVIGFIEKLPIEKFFGVGKVTAAKMHKYGIYKGLDLKGRSIDELKRLFGKQGLYYYNIARGIDERPVVADRIRKSIGAERTFLKDLNSNFQVVAELYRIEKDLFERIEKADMYGKTLTLKVKFHDFEQITRSKTYSKKITDFKQLHIAAKEILNNTQLKRYTIRLLGLSVSGFEDDKEDNQPYQLTIDF